MELINQYIGKGQRAKGKGQSFEGSLLRVFCMWLFALCSLPFALTTHAAFKESGWGARAAAMGGAFTAVANDADSVLWNPAGAAQLKINQYNLMHARLFAGLESVNLGLNSFSFVSPMGNKGTLGLAWTNAKASSVYREDSYLLSYSRSLYPFSVEEDQEPLIYGGANVKFLRNSFTLDQYTQRDPVFSGGRDRSAVTFDVGFLAHKGPYHLGVAVKNVTEPDMGFQVMDRVPREFRAGFAYRRSFLFFDNAALSIDFSRRDDDDNLHLGWENAFFSRRANFRAGWNNRELSFGFGYNITMPATWELGLNYAYIIPLQLAENSAVTHRISLVTRFGRQETGPEIVSLEIKKLRKFRGEVVDYKKGMKKARVRGTGLKQAQAALKRLQDMIDKRKIRPVKFISGSSKIATSSLLTLDRVVKLLRLYPRLKLNVYAHKDSAQKPVSEKLCWKRAKNVANYFMAKGIKPERLAPAVTDSGASSPTPDRKEKGIKQSHPIAFAFYE